MIKKIKSWLFENRNTRQTVVKNTFWMGVGTIVSRIIKAVVIIYAARVLGAEKYGVFSYALSLAAIFSLFADIGLSAVLTREMSRNPQSLEKNISTAFGIKLCLTAASFLLVAGVAPFFSAVKGAASLMPIAAILIAFDSLRDFSASLTRAWEKMEIEAGIGMATGVGITVFGLLAMWIQPTPFLLMLGYTAGSGLGLLVAILLLGKYLKKFWLHFDKELAKTLIKEALPFAVMGLLNALTVNIDAVMIGWLRSSAEVGLYAAAQRPVLFIYMASSLLASSTFPIVARSAGKDDGRVRTILEKTIAISFLAVMPIFVGGAILAPQLISLLFGAEYAPATATFATLLFTIILVFPVANIINGVFAYGEQKIMLYSLIIGGVGNVVFDYLLIRPFGILGSSFATIISQTLAYGLLWWKLKQINNFYTLRHLKKGFVAVAVMGLATFAMSALQIHVLINIAVSGLVYFGALIILKEKLVREAMSVFKMNSVPATQDV
ncbi:MAG: flippase [Candidatus Liptonbacteria bacterium]|nr:flippase [Candidatus Liptonbacteria bacterium]